MFNRIFDLLSGSPEYAFRGRPDQLQLAIAALLIQAAVMDDFFAPAERSAIERLLAARFGLSPDSVKALIEKAEKASQESNQLYSFTRIASERLNEQERVGVIEMLWEVAYADGVLDPDEDALVRRIAGLIYVSDLDRGTARKRVLERLGLTRQTIT